LLNDHFVRWRWPSWWTGKISDFAWLAFAPFVLVAVLAWLVPSRIAHRAERVGRMAFILTGLGFALAKTSSLCHTMAVRLLGLLVGWQVSLRRDPTDLLALPALLVGWYVWKQEDEVPTSSLSPRGWVVLALATVSTMANSPPIPKMGIVCLIERDQMIIARAYGSSYGHSNTFVSADGGLTWHERGRGPVPDECIWPERVQKLIDPADPQIQYRFTPGVAIERSEDAGQTWRPVVSLARDEALLQYYYRFRGDGTGYYWEQEDMVGPNDALIHQPTGHVVVAMGHEGVLARIIDGEWRLVPVGPYHQVNMTHVDNVMSLLSGELWLVPILVLLTTATMARHAVEMKGVRKGLLIVAWSLWSSVAILFPPVFACTTMLYGGVISQVLVISSALIAAPLGLKGALEIYRWSSRALVAIGIIAGSEVLLFLLPYVLWSQGTVLRWEGATLFALVLVGATMFAGDRHLKQTTNIALAPEVESAT
jgi:hypothetical protein